MELIVKPVGSLQANCYVLFDEASKEAVVIDPGHSGNRILDILNERGLKLKYVLLTHGHGDHIGGLPEILEGTGAQVLIHEADLEMLQDNELNYTRMIHYPEVHVTTAGLLEEEQQLEFGSIKIRVLHTPGHTKGGACFLIEDKLFAGDTLFNGSIGRTDFQGGSFDEIKQSIQEKLFLLDEDIVVYPGHGSPTTIKKEKHTNPFVGMK